MTGQRFIEDIEDFFTKLSHKGSLLATDYRDLPQATLSGAYPGLIKTTIKAVKAGLCFAMFQPFGKRNFLYEKHQRLSEQAGGIENPDLYENANQFVESYFYLINLAGKVREFYWNVKKEIKSEDKGQIVLYEAVYTESPNNVIPTMVASGIQSRLFYANFPNLDKHQTKIYEWVSAANDKHFFIERSRVSLTPEAVKTQFNPIVAYWEKNTRLPETEKERKEAYKNFGIKELFGKEETVEWEIWTNK